MKQKYLLAIFTLLTAYKAQAQLYMELYKTIGTDTSIQCMDASNGYWIIHTSL